MIINLRGPCGAGKSTLVRRLLADQGANFDQRGRLLTSGSWTRLDAEGKQLFLLDDRETLWRLGPVTILGTYHSDTGGGDSLTGKDRGGVAGLFELAASEHARHGGLVIFESMYASLERVATLKLAASTDLELVMLYVTPQECRTGVEERRLRRGVDKPYEEEKSAAQVRACRRIAEQVKAQQPQTRVEWLTRTEALVHMREHIQDALS